MGNEYIAQQFILFAHLFAFAFATAEVLRADWKFLNATTLNVADLKATSRRVKWLLGALWVTGLGLIVLKFGFDFWSVLKEPKLLSKLVVVSALTINGVIIHTVCIPLFDGRLRTFPCAPAIIAVLGGISTTTWVYAAFVGSARIVASHWSFDVFMALYLAALSLAILTAIVFVRPHVARVVLGTHSLTLPCELELTKSHSFELNDRQSKRLVLLQRAH